MAKNQEQQFASFFIGEKRYMLDISLIKEINSEFNLTPVPLAPAHVAGVINLRGSIVTVIDLGYCLGLGRAQLSEASHCLITKPKEDLPPFGNFEAEKEEFLSDSIGLLVDGIGDILNKSDHPLENPPPHLETQSRETIQNVMKLEGEIVANLNLIKILSSQETADPN